MAEPQVCPGCAGRRGTEKVRHTVETDGGGQLPLENVTTIATTSPAVASAAGLGGLLSNAASGTADGTAAANTPNLSTLFGLLSSLGAK